MNEKNQLAKEHLHYLCEEIMNRCVGSSGNIQATAYFENQLKKYNWKTEKQEFKVFDWNAEQAFVRFNNHQITVNSSPYSQTGIVTGESIFVSNIEELERADAKGKVLIIKGTLATEQLMPKNFTFYNPEHHKRIISLIEKSAAAALIFIVNQKGFYEGGEYPFPIIEDGDFLIPSVFMSEEDGERLIANTPEEIEFVSKTKISPSKGYNIIGRKGALNAMKIVICAHIDAKKGSSGAIDNATGIVVLLLLAEVMKDYSGPLQIELLALNGEDYYSVPGQMTYIESKKMDFSDILLNINIDGAGLNKGKTAVSFFNLPEAYQVIAENMLADHSNMVRGKQWFQGDHSLFLQYGVPAIAISSDWLLTNIFTQNITHTKKDNINIVDVDKITEIVSALSSLISKLK